MFGELQCAVKLQRRRNTCSKFAAFAVRGLLRVRRVHEMTALRAMSCAMNCEPALGDLFETLISGRA